MNVSLVCICVLSTLVLALGMNVSRLRGRRDAAAQFPTDPGDPLFKAVRAHGNTTEYAPTLSLLILVAALHDPAPWFAAVTVLVTGCRVLHAYAILASPTLAQQTVPRIVAAMGTYLLGLALVVAVLLTL